MYRDAKTNTTNIHIVVGQQASVSLDKTNLSINLSYILILYMSMKLADWLARELNKLKNIEQ